MLEKIIYLDHAASSPAYPEVVEAMIPYFSSHYGNPSSVTHPHGWLAKEAVENTRRIVADLIGAAAHEIFFTSGATEAVNWAHQAWYQLRGSGSHFITQPTEHKAVLETCSFLARAGAGLSHIKTGQDGLISISDLETQLRKQPDAFVSIMCVNNETGIKQPLSQIAELKTRTDFVFFCDATQAVCKEDINVKKGRVDALAFSAHKLGGPKGCGVLFMDEKLQQCGLKAFIHGGSQEMSKRAGTQNVPAIVGLGKAIENRHRFNNEQVIQLRDEFEKRLCAELNAQIIGANAERASHISSVYIPGLRSEELVMRINHQLAVSTGAACNSTDKLPSHVLSAMGFSNEVIFSTLRFSLGYNTTREELTQAIEILKTAIQA